MDKMQDIKLIALDLDGTTLADSDTLSKRTQTAIESAIKSGITVVAASGRPFVMMPDSVMNIVGLDYAITSNGAVISQCGKTVHRSLSLPFLSVFSPSGSWTSSDKKIPSSCFLRQGEGFFSENCLLLITTGKGLY